MTASVPDMLDAVLADSLARWTGAVKDRHSPLHTPVVTSVINDLPAPRIMVLRAVSPDGGLFRFHTDARSPKAQHIGAGAPIAVLAYDPAARVQLIARGTARIEHQGAIADTAWDTSALSSRRCYLAAHAPGTPVTEPTSGLPEHLLARAPTAAESEAGRPQFSVLLIDVRELEWLLLTSCGNKRARFQRNAGSWQGQWITP
jgi:pyridoxamine 5'-phosphate oxidase